jgi:hypothetical protein
MNTRTWIAAALIGAGAVAAGPLAQAQDKPAPAASSPARAAAQKTFATADEAAAALADAVRAGDVTAMLAVIGPASKNWLFSGDRVADRADWKKFLDAYDAKHALEPQGDAKMVLAVGNQDWPFPAPIVKKGDRWMFDADAGREEILFRRIGHNELDTIQTLLAIVDAQREYASLGNGMAAYASRFASTPGKHDGLYWPTKAGEPPSPLGPLVAEAVRGGYTGGSGKPQPYHGYYFRMLTGQGKHAPGGAYDYLVNGKLFGGFGVVAYPAKYRVSGVKTFIVNHDGVVYEKDLGPATATEGAKMTRFDPGPGWVKVQ